MEMRGKHSGRMRIQTFASRSRRQAQRRSKQRQPLMGGWSEPLRPLQFSVIRHGWQRQPSMAGLAGSISAAATLGDFPPVVASATLDAGLLGSISGAASLGQAIAINATATLTGGLTGSISGAATIADATVPRRIVGLIAKPERRLHRTRI